MKTEILAPAGSLQSARAALLSGADAVYLGLKEFSARESAENFDAPSLANVTAFAHLLGAKVYVCLNTLVKDGELSAFFSSAVSAWNAGADGILVQDLFLGKALKERCPEMVLHLSTQGGCNNLYGARLAKDFGFSRVVLARETPLAEIKKIAAELETEVFVQGALCTCFSGQCYFSSFAGNNSGNRGRCKQPCRKKYSVDRAGCEDFAYALSTSDLCAGERVNELISAGVCSLKIEGRLRRPEYVAAAVRYYRALVDRAPSDEAFSHLKRAYNRGDYTRGLAFGQQSDFLSREVQGHIGEKVGTVSLRNGKYFCKSDYRAQRGDGFKILRGGREVGGAALESAAEDGFFLGAKPRLQAGDEVRLTTDTAGGEALLRFEKLRQIDVRVHIVAGELPAAVCGGFVFKGNAPVPAAVNAPLSEESICACFQKTDGLPFAPAVEAETQNAFLPKSALNEFRRNFYAALAEYLSPARTPVGNVSYEAAVLARSAGKRSAEIICGGRSSAEIVIYKPADYAKIDAPNCGKERFLYLPPLLSERDEAEIAPALAKFDGVYCEGYYGIPLARKYGKKLFAGAGCNLTNRVAVNGMCEAGADYFVLSHELSSREQQALSAEGAFVLAEGSIKVMELCYCPFSRTCADCDRRAFYAMTDEDGRKFPLRRYQIGGKCRFEVYNCVSLAGEAGIVSRLADSSASEALKNAGATRGHANRSML